MVESAAKIYSKPAINFSTRQWQIEGKTVLEIQIKSSAIKPHFAKDENGKWMAYVRIDDENFLAHKIQINIWKKQNSTSGIYFTYSNDEKFLIELLHKFPSITFSKFIRLAHISRRKAEEILTNFVLMDIIIMNVTNKGTTFSLNENADEIELNKFK